MVIQASDEEWDILCRNRIIKIKEGRSLLVINEELSFPIQRETSIEDKTIVYTTASSYDKEYLQLIANFPTSDGFDNFPETRSDLLKDTKNVAKSRYIVLRTQHKLSADDIIKALRHEVERRKKASILKGYNDLTYMNGLPAWLNNVTNIKGQLEDSNKPVQVNSSPSLFEDV